MCVYDRRISLVSVLTSIKPWRRAVSTSSSKFTSLRGWTREEENEDYYSWQREEEGRELLFYMPREVDKHSLMWLPSHVGVLHPKSPAIRLVWEDSVHGMEWAECYLGELEDNP